MTHPAPCRPAVLAMHPNPLVRAGIVSSLRAQGDFDVFEGSPDAADLDGRPVAVAIADLPQALNLAVQAAPLARPSLAATRILVLATSDREEDIRRAIAAGIHGYVLLGAPLGEFVEGVLALAQGERYLGRSVAARVAESLTRVSLTSRESQVLQLVVAGESNKAIARLLLVEVGTVKTHMNAILSKLSATSRTQAAAIAINRGLVEERLPPHPAPMSRHSPRVASTPQAS